MGKIGLCSGMSSSVISHEHRRWEKWGGMGERGKKKETRQIEPVPVNTLHEICMYILCPPVLVDSHSHVFSPVKWILFFSLSLSLSLSDTVVLQSTMPFPRVLPSNRKSSLTRNFHFSLLNLSLSQSLNIPSSADTPRSSSPHPPRLSPRP